MAGPNKLALAESFARAAAITAFAFKFSHYIPRSLRAILLFLVALNIRTFPLVWHGEFDHSCGSMRAKLRLTNGV